MSARAPTVVAVFGEGEREAAVALTGAGVAAAAMLLASPVPSFRRIEINHDDVPFDARRTRPIAA